MLIIFGRRRKVFVLANLFLACRLGHSAVHRLTKTTTWITLFFLPVAPVKNRYASKCTLCGTTTYLSKPAAAELSLHPAPVPATAQELPAPASGATAGPAAEADQPGAAGWYPDPSDATMVRWWSGAAWTRTVRPHE